MIGIAFGFNLAEASGFIYIVYSFLLLYALNGNFGYIKNTATSKTEAAQILYWHGYTLIALTREHSS